MCTPVSDHIIVEMWQEGKLWVAGGGMGTVWVRNERTGVYAPAAEQIKPGGKRHPDYVQRITNIKWKGKTKTLRIHRIVYVVLHGPTPFEIDHIDNNTLNCGDANLKPVTRLENQVKAMEWRRELEDRARGIVPEEEPF